MTTRVWLWTVEDDEGLCMSGVATTREIAKRELWREMCEMGDGELSPDVVSWHDGDRRSSAKLDDWEFVILAEELVSE